jgi:hypothetical protein
MTLEKHLVYAGRAYVILGAIAVVACVVLAPWVLHDFRRLGMLDHAEIRPFCTRLLWALCMVGGTGILHVVIGLAIARQRKWATMVVGFPWSLLTLLAFPFGTAVGGYSLWVLVRLDKQLSRMTEH